MEATVHRKVGDDPSGLGVTFVIIGLFAAFSYVLLAWYDYSNGLGMLALLGLIQITPFAISLSTQHYNYLSFVMINHFFTYTVAKLNEFYSVERSAQLRPEEMAAIQQLTICSLLIIVSYLFIRYFILFSPSHVRQFRKLSLRKTYLLVVAAVVIGMPLYLHLIPTALTAVYFSFILALIVLMICSECPESPKLGFWINILILGSTMWNFVSSGTLSLTGHVAAYFFIVACLQKRWRVLLVAGSLVIGASFLQTVKSDYRQFLRGNNDVTNLERVTRLKELLMTQVRQEPIVTENSSLEDSENPDQQGVDDILSQGFSRVGDDSLERVLAWTPSRVPFWGGETYTHLIYLFIPRFLWADKPSRGIWYQFGRAYGYLGEDDIETSVGVSFLAEGYMNFGFIGLYIVALIFGALAAVVEHFSYYYLKGYFYFSFICFLMPMLYFGIDLTSMITSILIIACTLVLLRNQVTRMAMWDQYSAPA